MPHGVAAGTACGLMGRGAIVVALLLLAHGPAQAGLPTLAEVEQAVLKADAGPGSLKENWEPVVQLLRDVNERTPDPVLRMIKGPVCLATNKNNEALCLFLSVQKPAAKKRWLAWAEDFAARHPEAPIAHYLHGDALARAGQWEEAIAKLSDAINKAAGKRHALALNARAVAHAHRKALNLSIADLDAAQEAAPQFADAFASLANVYVQKRDGAKGAYRNFDAAVRLSNGFALALAGRGAMRLVLKIPAEGYRDAARKDFEKAIANSGCQLALVESIIARAALCTQDEEYQDELFALSPKGTSFYKDLMRAERRFMERPTAKSAEQYASSLAQLRYVDPGLYNKKITAISVDPNLTTAHLKAIAQVKYLYNPLGDKERRLAQIPQQTGAGVGGGAFGVFINGSSTIGLPREFYNYNKRRIDSMFRTLNALDRALERNSSLNRPYPYGPKGPPVRMPEDRWRGGVSANFTHLSALQWPLDATYSLAYTASADTSQPE